MSTDEDEAAAFTPACSACGGDGEQYADDDPDSDDSVPCPYCHGTGRAS